MQTRDPSLILCKPWLFASNRSSIREKGSTLPNIDLPQFPLYFPSECGQTLRGQKLRSSLLCYRESCLLLLCNPPPVVEFFLFPLPPWYQSSLGPASFWRPTFSGFFSKIPLLLSVVLDLPFSVFLPPSFLRTRKPERLLKMS